eukprot:Gregarina_sp_Poly_1__3585@NODE_204_length_11513_cov_91_076009_g182_i0_p2_GENE_NODE_204_length_11513_cov_91_076009_g182_i0NODE_204_length_11513_cov_91_076009_g182_i0_p2_ORF_typecomplete_len326_score50_03_NODE_204_length_11513_cov_91_076009_g182_i039544931
MNSQQTGTKRPSTEEAADAPASKRSRKDTTHWQDFLPAEHASGLLRYAHSLLQAVRDREKAKLQIEAIPGAVDLIFDAICSFIGDVWQFCVELSRVRIDVAVHELWRDQIQEDLDPMFFLESLNVFDEQERAKVSSLGSTNTDASGRNLGQAQDDSDINRSPSGLTRKKKKRLASTDASTSDVGANVGNPAAPTPPLAAATPMTGNLLFGTSQIGPQASSSATPEEKAREASLVQRKQAELSRQVEVDDVRAALALCQGGGSSYVVACPPRIRRAFGHLSCMYYEPFMERVAAMRAQGLSGGGNAQFQTQQRAMIPPHLQQPLRR